MAPTTRKRRSALWVRMVLGTCAVVVVLAAVVSLIHQLPTATRLFSNTGAATRSEMSAPWTWREKRAADEDSVKEATDGETDENQSETKHTQLSEQKKSVNKKKEELSISMSGIRFDTKLQECTEPLLKKTFPDVDYAMLGYDILKGYPLAMGHDPGFTHPIFYANYSEERQTADCRFSIPAGYTIIPDISCVTSFKSDEVKNVQELSKSLQASANVKGGGWGVSFSASAEYQNKVETMKSKKTLFIISKATCDYYYATLNTRGLLPFDNDFLREAKLLAGRQNDFNLLNFIDYYGTHYSTEMKFGARFMYIHKVLTEDYTKLKESHISVSAQASYSGLFSVGGGFSMSSDHREAASNFASKVETTTVTVGAAPPANGDAMTWASTVKESPVPSKYSLDTIDNLFTHRHMGHLGFNYKLAQTRLRDFISGGGLNYRQLVKNGQFIIQNIYLESNDSETTHASQGLCLEKCLQKPTCWAISVCNDREAGCSPSAVTGNCIMHKVRNFKYPALKDSHGWKLMSNINAKSIVDFRPYITISKLWFKNWKDLSEMTSSGQMDFFECFAVCFNDKRCSIASHCEKTDPGCANLKTNCKLFAIDMLNHEKASEFISFGTTMIFTMVA